AFEQKIALSCVACERRCKLEFFAGFIGPSEFRKQVAAHAGQKVISAQGRFRGERIDNAESGLWPYSHGERDGAVQLDDRRGGQVGELFIERDDARPIRCLWAPRLGVTGSDAGLDGVRTSRSAQSVRTVERG